MEGENSQQPTTKKEAKVTLIGISPNKVTVVKDNGGSIERNTVIIPNVVPKIKKREQDPKAKL